LHDTIVGAQTARKFNFHEKECRLSAEQFPPSRARLDRSALLECFLSKRLNLWFIWIHTAIMNEDRAGNSFFRGLWSNVALLWTDARLNEISRYQIDEIMRLLREGVPFSGNLVARPSGTPQAHGKNIKRVCV
jgi:hypothetical protein